VHLDQVLGLAARTIEGVVYVLGRTGSEAGDDVADVEAEGCGLDAGTGAPTARSSVPLLESPNTKSMSFCSQKSITSGRP
jgi:hypothetical protein